MGLRHLYCLIALLIALLGVPALAQQGQGETPDLIGSNSLKVSMFSPTRGVMTFISDLARSDEYAQVLDNLQMLRKGIWTSRGIGHTKSRETDFNSGAAFKCLEPFYGTKATVPLIIMQVGSVLYKYDIATQTETSLKTGLSTTARGDLTYYSSTFMAYCNGDINPLKYTGTGSFTSASGWPASIASISFQKPAYSEYFAGRLVYAGFDNQPTTVVFSDYGNPEGFTTSTPQLATDCGFIALSGQLGPIVGLRQFRLDNQDSEPVLVIGCENGMAIITGNDATDFTAKEVTREYGLLSNDSWLQLGNDLYFMASDGLRRFSTSAGYSTLAGTAISAHLQDLYSRINLDEKAQAFVVHHPSTQEATWWFPIDDDTECMNGIVLNYNTQGPEDTAKDVATNTIKYPIFSTRSGVSYACGQEISGVLYYGTYDGYLLEGYSGDTYDGNAITWTYVSSLVGGPSPAHNISNRKFILLLDGPDQKFDVTAYTINQRGDEASTLTERLTKSINISSLTLSRTSTWDSGTSTSYPKLVEFSAPGSGRYWKIKIVGDATDEHISLAGVMAVMHVGGWKQ